MGKTKSMFMDLQVLIQHLEDQEELDNYMKRRKSKAFSIKKALEEYNQKQSKDEQRRQG